MAKKVNNIIKKNNYVTLSIGETNYQTLLTKKFKNRKPYIPADFQKIYSYIPGTIVKVLVKPGQLVAPGDTIAILDAMKMMNRIILVEGGIIKSINVREGEIVPRKHLIAEVE